MPTEIGKRRIREPVEPASIRIVFDLVIEACRLGGCGNVARMERSGMRGWSRDRPRLSLTLHPGYGLRLLRRQRWRACEREPLPLNTARQAGLRAMRWRRMQAAVVFSSGINWPHSR